MIKWLVRMFIVWVAIIHVASANEEALYGWQQLVPASNEAAPATTTGLTAFPPVQRESRTAENTLNTRKKARLPTDESDDDLLTIGLGTRAAYPSYPGSFRQSSRSGVTSVLTENPIHLANNHEHFKSNDHQLFPSGVSLEQFNSLASSSTTRRDFFSDFDKTHETGASVSTEHDIPTPTSPPASLSESFNLGRKTQFHAPITQGPVENSVSHKQDGERGVKRKIWNFWGDSLSLKTGVILDENEAQHSHSTLDFLSGFPSAQPNRLSDEENCITTPKLNLQEIQQVIRLSQLGSNTPFYQNEGASTAPVMSVGGRRPWEMSSIAGMNGENDSLSYSLSLNPSEKGENGNIWGSDQGKTYSPRSQPQNSLRAEQNILVDWPRSTEPLLNQSPRPHHKIFESVNEGSSSKDPETMIQVSKIPKPHQPESFHTVGNHPSLIAGMSNFGRIKFNTYLFEGKGPYQLKQIYASRLLNSIPRPYQGKFLFTGYQLDLACAVLRRKHPSVIQVLSMSEIRIFMGNINRWYKYWNTHANIDFQSFGHEVEVSNVSFVFPLFLLYVEMIISIIPFKQDIPLEVELDYPQEMRNAIKSYLEFNKIMKTNPKNGESTVWNKRWYSYMKGSDCAKKKPSGILWTFIEVWMESHYTAVWNKVKEKNGLHACRAVKASFNAIFTHGIEALNDKLISYIPHE